MGRKRKQRRQSHGSAWHWKQTGCWYYTMPGTKKRVPLFDEEGQRIRGESNKEAAELALAKEKLSWEDGAFGAPDGSGPWLVPIGNERIPTSRLRLSEAWRPMRNDNAGLAARHGTGGKPTAGTTRRRGRNGVCRWSAKMASESVERTTARPRNWRWRGSVKLADWMENNVPESLTVFCLPARHRVRMRTSKMLERLNREIKRRTRVVSIFPNDDALLRLASAVLMEVDEGSMSGRKHLTMHTH